jgi:thymidylate synthase
MFSIQFLKGANNLNKADVYLTSLIREILTEGTDSLEKVRTTWQDGKSAGYRYVTMKRFEYDLSKGEVPYSGIRPIAKKNAVNESRWIYQDKSNDVNLLEEKYGIYWWRPWAGPDGTINKAYGFQVGKKHPYPQGEMDMIDNLLWTLKNNPMDRRLVLTMFNLDDLHEMNLPPCAHTTTWMVRGEYLDMNLEQRSNDIIAAFAINAFQYAALLMMVAKATGYKPGKFVHDIANAHIYDRHMDVAHELLKRPIYPQPTITLADKDDFYAFTPDDFIVDDYQVSGEQLKFEIAI